MARHRQNSPLYREINPYLRKFTVLLFQEASHHLACILIIFATPQTSYCVYLQLQILTISVVMSSKVSQLTMGHHDLDLKLILTAKKSDLNVFYFAFSLLFGDLGVHFADFIAFYASFR